MSTNQFTKSEIIADLQKRASKMQETHAELQKMAQEFNKMMFDAFGVMDDGKNLGRLDLINLILKLTSEK